MKGACPFVSADILARLPQDKKKELEKYYHDMMTNQAEENPINSNTLMDYSSKESQEIQCPVMHTMDEEKLVKKIDDGEESKASG